MGEVRRDNKVAGVIADGRELRYLGGLGVFGSQRHGDPAWVELEPH